MIVGAVLTHWVCIPLAPNTHSGPAFPADHVEGVLGINAAPWWNEFVAAGVGAEYSGLPGRTVLLDSLEEQLLFLAGEEVAYRRGWDGLRAASGRHLGLIGRGLFDHYAQAVSAVGMATGQSLEIILLVEVVTTAYAR